MCDVCAVERVAMLRSRPSSRRTLMCLVLLVMTPQTTLCDYTGNHSVCRSQCAAFVDSDKYQVHTFKLCTVSTKEEVHVFVRVCLSVCVQDYSKTRAWIWMKCCVSTDVGTWTN